MYKSENLNKIWKFKNPRWRPPVTSFIWLVLPWKPIKHHVVPLNWKYKWSLLYVPSFKSIEWIVSKVEGGGVRLTPPSRLCVTIFSSRLLGLMKDVILIFYTQVLIRIWLSYEKCAIQINIAYAHVVMTSKLTKFLEFTKSCWTEAETEITYVSNSSGK